MAVTDPYRRITAGTFKRLRDGTTVNPPAPTLQMVQPMSSQKVYESYGICEHPNFSGVYANRAAVQDRLQSVGAYAFRGMYEGAGSQATIDLARARGLKWLATVAPETGYTDAMVMAKIEHMAANAADVIIGIEGQNEPNHNRDGSPVDPNWPALANDIQTLIYNKVRSYPALNHVKVLSCSLHDTVVRNSNGQDWQDLANVGMAVGVNIDMAGMHGYPGGLPPDDKLDLRLGYIRNAFGPTTPVWLTETGYHDAYNVPTSAHKYVPEGVAATYAPRSVLVMAERNVNSMRYELLDDPDTAFVEHEFHFGIYRTPSANPSTWTEKPEVGVMRAFLAALKDPGTPYTPAPVGVSVTSSVSIRSWVTCKRDGSCTLHMVRPESVWNRIARTMIDVPAASVTVLDAAGERTFSVNADVMSVPLRRA